MSGTFGLIPLHGNDVWLHGVLALAGIYFGWMHREGCSGREAELRARGIWRAPRFAARLAPAERESGA